MIAARSGNRHWLVGGGIATAAHAVVLAGVLLRLAAAVYLDPSSYFSLHYRRFRAHHSHSSFLRELGVHHCQAYLQLQKRVAMEEYQGLGYVVAA